jgi:hypothetical protein
MAMREVERNGVVDCLVQHLEVGLDLLVWGGGRSRLTGWRNVIRLRVRALLVRDFRLRAELCSKLKSDLRLKDLLVLSNFILFYLDFQS